MISKIVDTFLEDLSKEGYGIGSVSKIVVSKELSLALIKELNPKVLPGNTEDMVARKDTYDTSFGRLVIEMETND